MLLPPLTIPLLNATSLLLANSSIDIPPKYPVYCYQQRPADQPQRLRALSVDCFTLARRLVRRIPHPTEQIAFSHDPSKGLKVPRRFHEKTCEFEVNLPEEARGGWSASFADIAFGANEINAPCVHDGLHLGGLTKIGRKGKLDLHVYGREYVPPTLPTDVSSASSEDGEETATS